MARMIPAICPATASPGEKLVFQALANAHDTEDWIVLYSLRISEHINLPDSEADFVVIAPNLGILVLEIKSHLAISINENGVWRMGSERKPRRSPFTQSREAMYSLKSYLKDFFGSDISVPFTWAVWFTHLDNSLPQSIEWEPWRALYAPDLRRKPETIIREIFSKNKEKTRDFVTNYSDANCPLLDSEAVGQYLRPTSIEMKSSNSNKMLRRENLHKALIKQCQILETMQDNRVVLFGGSPGWGRSLVAANAARAQARDGGKGAVICATRHIAEHLYSLTRDHSNIFVGYVSENTEPGIHWTSLVQWVGENGNKFSAYWARERLELAFLIIDEVENFSKRQCESLVRIVESNRDVETQRLFADQLDSEPKPLRRNLAVIESKLGGLVRFQVNYNCRNLQSLDNFRTRIIGYGLRRYLRQDFGGGRAIHIETTDESIQVERIVEAHQRIVSLGFEADEIVWLYPESLADSDIERLMQRAVAELEPAQLVSVVDFRGRDAPAVVMFGLEGATEYEIRNFMEIGIASATDAMAFVGSQSSIWNSGRSHQ